MDFDHDYDDYCQYEYYDSDDAELRRPEFNSNDELHVSDRIVTLVSGTDQNPNAVDCDQTVETWIIKDANTTLARKSAEHKFNFQLKYQRFPGVTWSVSLSLPKKAQNRTITDTEQMIFSHSAKFNGDAKHCWTSIVAELIRIVKMPEASSSEKDQAEARVKVLGSVSLGPNELTNREASGVKCEGWSLPLMQSAINDDGTVHICLTLSLHDIGHAIRSRDLIHDLRQSGIFSDFIIKVDQHQFPVHKCVLATASDDFKPLFRDTNLGDSLDLTGVGTASGVKAFLAVIYCAEYSWKCDNDPIATIRNVLLLADQYKVKQVECQIIRVVPKLVSLDNVWDFLSAAVENNALCVAAACFTFMLQNRGTIAKSKLVAKLTVNSERDGKVRSAFIEAFFNQQLPCSPRCKCTKPTSVLSRRPNANDMLMRFPNEDLKLPLSWLLLCSKADLDDNRELSGRAKEDPSFAQALGRNEGGIWWQLQLYPRGRNESAMQQGFASFVLSLVTCNGDFGQKNEFHARWAYAVEVNLDVGGVKIPADLGSVPESPFEFTNKAEGLAIDCAWPASTLRDAVVANENIIIKITAELRVLDTRDVLSCCEATLSKSADREAASQRYLPLRQLTGSNIEHFQTFIETWTIKNAAKALESLASLRSCSGSYRHAFEFREFSAFPGLRLKVHPSPSSIATAVSSGSATNLWRQSPCVSKSSKQACKSDEANETSSFSLSAQFGLKADSIRYCGAFLVAEIKRSSPLVDAEATINPLTLGPVEFGDEQSDLQGRAWPLDVMRSAVNVEDDTLSIQLTLLLFKINEAVQMFRSIRELRTNGRGYDFTFKLGDEQFGAHKCILAAASEEFQKLFCGEEQTSEFVLPEKTTAAGVKAFLALIYFAAYDWLADANIADTVSDVLILAYQYKIERLKKQAADVVVKILSTGNAVRLLEAAISCEASSVKHVCITFLLENRAEIRNTDCVAQLLGNDRISGEFLSAFFGQNLCCSRSCDCAKPAAAPSRCVPSHLRNSCKEKSTPESVRENEPYSYTWVIENAAVSLNQPSLQHALRFEPDLNRWEQCSSGANYAVRGRRHQEQRSSWKATMLPGGRTSIAQHEEFASLSVAFIGSFPGFCGADYFWAYVQANAENTPGSVRMLFEFTPKSTTLSIDKFCLVAALRKAIRSDDNTLHIRVKITPIGDIPAALRCQELLRVVYEQRVFTDFILTCKDESIQVLAALLASDMKEAQEGRLNLSDVATVAGVKSFIDAVYFGELNCEDDEVLLELLKLSHQFGLADVKSHCDQQLARNIDMENVLDILATCELYGLQVAKSACVRFLGENGLKFLKSSTWQDLNKNESEVEILKSQVGLLQTLTKELLLHGKFRDVDE